MDREDQADWWDDWQRVDAFWRQYIDTRPQPPADVEESLLDVPF